MHFTVTKLVVANCNNDNDADPISFESCGCRRLQDLQGRPELRLRRVRRRQRQAAPSEGQHSGKCLGLHAISTWRLLMFSSATFFCSLLRHGAVAGGARNLAIAECSFFSLGVRTCNLTLFLSYSYQVVISVGILASPDPIPVFIFCFNSFSMVGLCIPKTLKPKPVNPKTLNSTPEDWRGRPAGSPHS